MRAIITMGIMTIVISNIAELTGKLSSNNITIESQIERLFVSVRLTVKTSLVIIQKNMISVDNDMATIAIEETPLL